MAIPPAITASLQVLTTASLGSAVRDGQILQARVTAMLSNTLARLAIEGHSVDVATPKPLPVGTMLALKAQWQGGQLQLTTQVPAAKGAPAPQPGAPPPAPTLQSPPPNLIDPVRTTLAKIQALTVEAMLTGKGGSESAPAQHAAAAARAQPEAAPARPAAPELAAQRGPNNAPAAATSATPNERAAETGQRASTAAERSEASQRPGAPEMLSGQIRGERMASFTVDVPVFLPGNEAPLRLQIMHDEGGETEDGRRAAPRSWMVRFGAEAGTLGMIHAAISMIDGHIGVQLWAERDDTADFFKENSGQLSDALKASDLKLDAVRVTHGSPSADVEETA